MWPVCCATLYTSRYMNRVLCSSVYIYIRDLCSVLQCVRLGMWPLSSAPVCTSIYVDRVLCYSVYIYKYDPCPVLQCTYRYVNHIQCFSVLTVTSPVLSAPVCTLTWNCWNLSHAASCSDVFSFGSHQSIVSVIPTWPVNEFTLQVTLIRWYLFFHISNIPCCSYSYVSLKI